MVGLPVPAMTKRQAKRLLKLLGELHEKAYRRGFQHGHASSSGMFRDEPTPTHDQVSQWRHRGYGDCEPPPQGGYHKRKKPVPVGYTVVDRMMCEAAGDIARWLRGVEQVGKTISSAEVSDEHGDDGTQRDSGGGAEGTQETDPTPDPASPGTAEQD